MIHSIAIPLLVLGFLFAYKIVKRNKKRFHTSRTNQLPS